MFTKLLKYEWKATAGLLGILSLAALGVSVTAGFILRYLIKLLNGADADVQILSALIVPLVILLVFLFLALAVYGFGVQVILHTRFYRSRFTDEGYLTFTLPVRSSQIFLSSLANTLIWSVLSALVLFLSLAVIALIAGELENSAELLADLDGLDAYKELWAMEGYIPYRILSMLHSVAAFFSGPVMIMTCITLGATLAKKHKILAALGLYYGLTMAINTLESAIEVTTVLDNYTSATEAFGGTVLLVMGIQALLQVGIAVGGSFLSVWLMDKKLNLP